jgi:hypothetical protein
MLSAVDSAPMMRRLGMLALAAMGLALAPRR